LSLYRVSIVSIPGGGGERDKFIDDQIDD
jgi:hypothetical protein